MPKGQPLSEDQKAAMQAGRKRAKEAREQDLQMSKIAALTDQAISARNSTALRATRVKTGQKVRLVEKTPARGTWKNYQGKVGEVVSLNPSSAEILVKSSDFSHEVWFALGEWESV